VHSPVIHLTREVSFSFLLSFLWASILILAVVGSFPGCPGPAKLALLSLYSPPPSVAT